MRNSAFTKIVVVCIGIEVVVFVWLSSLGQDGFKKIVSSPDTVEYVQVAHALAEKGQLIASRRTLGYPMFMALGYGLGGDLYGPQIVIAVQLILNVVFTFLCWRLLERITPNVSVGLRAVATLVFFWAGLGMALNLLSDFLASFLFAVFLYGMLFWRKPLLCILSGSCLAVATLTRPTFILIPFLVPLSAFLVGRVTSKVPASYVLVFIFSSLAATGASIVYQYRLSGYLGPSSVVSQNIGRMLSYDDYEEFRTKIADYAHLNSAGDLSPAEEEKYARELFWQELFASPQKIILPLLQTLVKYIFVPIEYVVAKFTVFIRDDATYVGYVRPVLFAVFLPMWILFLIPPFRSASKVIAFYSLTMILLLYILGISLHTKDQGERIRFPMLAFMLPVILCNGYNLWRRASTIWCFSLSSDRRNKAVSHST